MNPLATRGGTVIAGIVLSLIFIFVYGNNGAGNPVEWTIWFHVVVGIAWIGLLYYFNAIQMPAVAAAVADEGGPGAAGINKYIAPRALFWFRWAALLTWLSGLSAIAQKYGPGLEGGGMEAIINAFTLSGGLHIIGVGAILGTIMLINVWMIIWPNQRRILGLNPEASSPEVIAGAKVKATMASRVNTMLSIPMLLSMTAAGHGLPF